MYCFVNFGKIKSDEITGSDPWVGLAEARGMSGITTVLASEEKF